MNINISHPWVEKETRIYEIDGQRYIAYHQLVENTGGVALSEK